MNRDQTAHHPIPHTQTHSTSPEGHGARNENQLQASDTTVKSLPVTPPSQPDTERVPGEGRPLGDTTKTGTTEEEEVDGNHPEMVLAGIKDFFWMMDHQERLTYVNEKASKITGLNREELLGKSFWELFPDLLGTTFETFLRQAVTEQIPVQFEHFYPLKKRWYENRVYPCPTGICGFTTDITDRKKMEWELRQSEERFRILYEEAPIGYHSLDEDARILNVNPAWLDTLGYTRDEVIGRWFGDFLSPHSQDVFEQKFPCFKDKGKVRGAEFEVLRKDGSRILVSFDGRIGWDNSGNFRQTHCVFHDITERRRAEEELRRARDELELRVHERTAELNLTNRALREYAAKLERLNKELEDFAFIAAHDLQEPLRKIQAFGDRLKTKYKNSLEQGAKDYLERMTLSANRMSALLKSLLAFSRVATQDNTFALTDLSKVIREAVSDLELRIEQSGGYVEIGDLPAVEVDETQMRQLFQNLISNAIKYGKDREKPLVKVYGRKEGNTCRIYVEDNGIGFEEIYTDRIFRPFQRLHRQGVYEGTGMGLAVCRKIAEHHGGSITVRSTPGQGSTFIVLFPVKQIEGGTHGGYR